ncbi:ATPase [Bryobacterales bacterium F-183]|nr:ATPase [Bryobacterales bacterium F-183]
MSRTAALAPRLGDLEASLSTVIRGKTDAVRLSLVCLLARGHLLIEDVPGVGKTTLAHALARSTHTDFQRIQFTADLLPGDVLGVTIFNTHTQQFEFKPGPVFTHFLLADEINRATPKTQSALLEAMNEDQITLDGESHPLRQPFMVIATQNPVEHHGTYPLPESQLDRFMMRIRMGYPDTAAERAILRSNGRNGVDALQPVLSEDEVLELQQSVHDVAVDDAITDYILAVVERTRTHDALALGVSPRGSQALYRAAQASALLDGRNYVIPDDAKRLVLPVFSHRVIVNSRSALARGTEAAERILQDILTQIPVPH